MIRGKRREGKVRKEKDLEEERGDNVKRGRASLKFWIHSGRRGNQGGKQESLGDVKRM